MYPRNRNRNRGTNLAYTITGEVWDRNGNCVNSTSWRTTGNTSSGSAFVGTYESMSDFVVPGFDKRKRAGEVFFNPLRHITYTVSNGFGDTPVIQSTVVSCPSNGPFYAQQRAKLNVGTPGRVAAAFGLPVNGDGSLRGFASLLSSSEIASAITEVSTSCLNQRGRADSNLYETLAEFDKSAGVIASIARSAAKTVAQKRRLLQRSKDLGNAYLAYRYGLKPVMADMATVLEGLLSKVGKVRQTSRASTVLNTTVSTSNSDVSWLGLVTAKSSRLTHESLVIRAMSLDEYMASVGSNVGFTAKGLITLPWELLPYSFVADWFLNIGDLLGALTPTLGYKQLGSCIVTTNHRQDTDTIGLNTAVSGYSVVTPLSGSCTRDWTVTERVTGLSSPGLVIRNDFRLSNITRAADSLALLAQKLHLK